MKRPGRRQQERRRQDDAIPKRDLIADLRQQHQVYGDHFRYCKACGKPWPCIVGQVLDTASKTPTRSLDTTGTTCP